MPALFGLVAAALQVGSWVLLPGCPTCRSCTWDLGFSWLLVFVAAALCLPSVRGARAAFEVCANAATRHPETCFSPARFLREPVCFFLSSRPESQRSLLARSGGIPACSQAFSTRWDVLYSRPLYSPITHSQFPYPARLPFHPTFATLNTRSHALA